MPEKRRQTNTPFESNTQSQWLILPLMLAVAGILAVAYSIPDSRNELETRGRFILDHYHNDGRKTPVRDDIVILGIDDASRKLDTLWPEELEVSQALQHMQQGYPFRRSVWAMLADRLFRAGARMVFLDLTLGSTAPIPEDDQALHEALVKYSGKLILGAKYDVAKGAKHGLEAHTVLAAPVDAIIGPDGLKKYHVGSLNFFTDGDGVVRTFLPYVDSSMAERLILGDESSFKNSLEVPLPHIALVLGEAVMPGIAKDLPEVVAFRFCEEASFPDTSLHQVFVESFWKNNLEDGAVFKDKIVMVGAVAKDLQDFQPTPFGEPAGVKLHAHALSALLAGEFLNSAPWWWVLASLSAGLIAAWILIVAVRQPLLTMVGLTAATVGVYYGCAWAFDQINTEVSPLPFSLALNLCGLSGLGTDYFFKLRESRKLSRFLARYTSPELVREMMRDKEGIYTTLKGQKKIVTILFSDVRGFTSMSEAMEASAMVSQLNEYLKRMVDAVVEHRGLVDKFIGDAVMALWGTLRQEASEEADNIDAFNAVQAALKMRATLEILNKEWVARGVETFKFGIGIHQGEVVSGNIGSDDKMDLTVIGDNVNLTSRLEGVTKEYGVDLVISEAVRVRVDDKFRLRSADLVKVKGKKKPVAVFSVLGDKDFPRPDGLDDYEAGVATYREGNFTEALGSFNLAAEKGLSDTLTKMYRERCEHLIQNPPETWDGTYEMTKK